MSDTTAPIFWSKNGKIIMQKKKGRKKERKKERKIDRKIERKKEKWG